MHTMDPTDPVGPAAAPAGLRDALARIEADERLDRIGSALAGFGRTLNGSPAGPLLRGELGGHSPHATIATLRIGVLGSSLIAGVIGGRSGQKVAGRLAGLGVAMTLPTAVTAVVELDRSGDDPRVRRLGAVYSLANAVTGGLFFRAWLSRARGNGFRGVMWSLLGAGPATVAAYLGTHLVATTDFGRGPRGLDAPIVEGSAATTPVADHVENAAETAAHTTVRTL
jgi:hypothetical protein